MEDSVTTFHEYPVLIGMHELSVKEQQPYLMHETAFEEAQHCHASRFPELFVVEVLNVIQKLLW